MKTTRNLPCRSNLSGWTAAAGACLLLAGAWLGQAATGHLLLVTDRADLEEGTNGFAGFLRSQGWIVEVTPSPNNASTYQTLDSEKIQNMESKDAVVVSRATNSGSYDDGTEPSDWNNLRVPLILCNAYIARNNPPRWDWLNGSQARRNIDTLEFVNPDHPIVAGLSPMIHEFSRRLDYVTATDAGNGELIANVTGGGAAIVVWEPYNTDPAGTNYFMGTSGQTYNHRRVWFALLNYHENPTGGQVPFGGPSHWDDLTEDGELMVARAVAYTAGTLTAPLQVVSQPVSVTVLAGQRAEFNAGVIGRPPIRLQWQRNDGLGWSDIPDANYSLYALEAVSGLDDGARFRLVATNEDGTVISDEVTLSVLVDTEPPVVVSAWSVNETNIGVCFNEVLDPTTATDQFNYIIEGGAVDVAEATLRYDGKTVLLSLGTPLLTNGFTLDVSGVRDPADNLMVPQTVSGGTERFWNIDLDAPSAAGSAFSCRPGEIELIGGGSDLGGTADSGHFAYQEVTGDFDKVALVRRLDNTAERAKGGWMVRETLAPDSRNLYAVVFPPRAPVLEPGEAPPYAPEEGDNRYEVGTRQTTGGDTVGWGVLNDSSGHIPATHPNSWVRLRRVGDVFQAFASTNGTDWVLFGQSVQDYPDTALVGLVASAGNNDGRTNRVWFQHIGDFPGYAAATIAVVQQPESVAVIENRTATFTVNAVVNNAPAEELIIQWQRDDGAGGFTNIFGANSPSFSTVLHLGDNGAQFRAVLTVPGAQAISEVATATVLVDTEPPVLLAAHWQEINPRVLNLVFDEALEPVSATDFFNYELLDETAGGAVVPIDFNTPIHLSADGTTVTLTTIDPLVTGQMYRLYARGLSDLASNTVVETWVLVSGQGCYRMSGPQNLVVLEAENYDFNSGPVGGSEWMFTNSPPVPSGYGGTGAMGTWGPPGSGRTVSSDYAANSPRLDYCVEFTTAGVYYVWLRGSALDGSSDSAHIGYNGQEIPTSDQIGGAVNNGLSGWVWIRDTDEGPAIIDIPAPGAYTINLWMREDGLLVDRLLLTTDPDFDPNTINDGFGPPESPRLTLLSQIQVTISREANGDLTLRWDTPGVLQQADNLEGPWTDVEGAASPFTFTPTDAVKFFRVVLR